MGTTKSLGDRVTASLKYNPVVNQNNPRMHFFILAYTFPVEPPRYVYREYIAR